MLSFDEETGNQFLEYVQQYIAGFITKEEMADKIALLALEKELS